RGGRRCASRRCTRRSGDSHQYHSAYGLVVRPLHFLAQALDILFRNTVWIFLEQRENVLDSPMSALKLIDHALQQRRTALIISLADAAPADVLEQFFGQSRLVIDRRDSRGRGRGDPRKRRQELIWIPQPPSLLDDPCRLDGDTSARPLLGRRKIRSSGD